MIGQKITRKWMHFSQCLDKLTRRVRVKWLSFTQRVMFKKAPGMALYCFFFPYHFSSFKGNSWKLTQVELFGSFSWIFRWESNFIPRIISYFLLSEYPSWPSFIPKKSLRSWRFFVSFARSTLCERRSRAIIARADKKPPATQSKTTFVFPRK